MKSKITFSLVARIIVALMLFWALAKHPYGYYTLLRWVTTGIAAYCAYLSYTLKRIPWAWIFGLTALMFNPIAPIRLDRQTWAYFDVATGVLFLLSIFFIRESMSHSDDQQT